MGIRKRLYVLGAIQGVIWHYSILTCLFCRLFFYVTCLGNRILVAYLTLGPPLPLLFLCQRQPLFLWGTRKLNFLVVHTPMFTTLCLIRFLCIACFAPNTGTRTLWQCARRAARRISHVHSVRRSAGVSSVLVHIRCMISDNIVMEAGSHKLTSCYRLKTGRTMAMPK